MKVEIKLRVSNKAINALAGVLDPGLESIFSTEIISFETKEPEKWITDERKTAFQNKMNEAEKGNLLYEVESVAIIN